MMTDKWGGRLFPTGAVVLILLGLVHWMSLLEKPAPANETERQLLDLMANYKFNVMGSATLSDSCVCGGLCPESHPGDGLEDNPTPKKAPFATGPKEDVA
ncbi:MAG: hypothetical protein WCC89_07255 [Candidatus Sulfotelmatobacter sp.]